MTQVQARPTSPTTPTRGLSPAGKAAPQTTTATTTTTTTPAAAMQAPTRDQFVATRVNGFSRFADPPLPRSVARFDDAAMVAGAVASHTPVATTAARLEEVARSASTGLAGDALQRNLSAALAGAHSAHHVADFWAPSSTEPRGRLFAALGQLAAHAPDAVVSNTADGAPMTARRALLTANMSDALLSGDATRQRTAGSAYLAAFPSDSRASFAHALVAGAPAADQHAACLATGGLWTPDSSTSPLLIARPADARQYDPTTAVGAAAVADLAYEPADKVVAALERAGYTNVEFIQDPLRSTQVFVAVKDDQVVVAFRGSQEKRDFLIDASGGAGINMRRQFGGLVHGGFASAYGGVDERVMAAVRRAQDGHDRPAIFVGHSLGGALAQLAAVDAKEHGLNVGSVYTFGSPRVGDRNFANHARQLDLSKITYRHVNESDLVPRVPELMLRAHLPFSRDAVVNGETNRYRHWGNLVYSDENNARSLNPSNQKLDERTKNDGVGSKLTNHGMGEYVANVVRQVGTP